MAVLLFTYDLNKERQKKGDYDGLYEVRNSYDYVKLSESSYALHTTNSPEFVYNQVKRYLDSNDTLYVINLRHPIAGQGEEAVNAWLQSRIPW